jgi:iron complex outermembrane receptor protein
VKAFVRLAIVAGLICLAAPETVLAQQLSISGVVQDTSGVLTGAEVTLRDPSGNTQKTKTNERGQFRFDGLRNGAYEVAASREGFAVATRTLNLTDASRTIDFTLQIAGIFTSVEVNDVAERSTAAGMDVPNRELPNYVVSISSRTLQEQGINDLPAALENVSGVITQVQYGVYEWYTIGGITQQSGNDFLYIDGMTLTGNRSMTQLNNIEEVQVLKGPNSILFGGSGAGQGGLVNLIRKKPSAVRSHDLQYRAGAWNLQEFTGASAGPVFGLSRLMYRVDGSFSGKDGWRQNNADRFNLSPSLTFLISRTMRVTANQTFIRDKYTLDAGLRRELINREGVPFDLKMNPAGDFQLTRDWQNQIIYTWEINDRLKLTNSFFTRRNRDQYLDAESMTYNAELDQVNRAYLYFMHNRRPLQNQADVQGNYTFWGMRHRPFVRYEFQNQYNFTNRTGNAPGASNSLNLPLPPVPVAQFIAGTWVDTAPVYRDFPITRVDHSTNRFHSVVLQDQFYPVEWLAANVTMRRGNYHRNTHNDNYNNGVFVAEGSLTRITNQVKSNYRAGFVVVPQDTWPSFIRGSMPYVSWNTSFNPVNQVQADGTPLEPVINESYEIGNKWQGLNNRLSILMAARRIQDRNRVVSLGNQMFLQVGRSTTYNADVDVEGRIGRGLSLIAAWGYAEGRIDRLREDGLPQQNGGLRFPHAPKHTARLSVTKMFNLSDTTALSVNLGGRHVSEYFLNTANTVTMPERTTFDGAVMLRRGDYDIGVNFTNLTDRERYFVSQINGGGLLYPGEPFNGKVTVRYRFQ